MTSVEVKLHEKVIRQLQAEWRANQQYHEKIRDTRSGICSSQISALVALLITKDVLKESDLQ